MAQAGLISMERILAELLGTFAPVPAGTGAIVVNDLYGGVITHVGIALTLGMVVMAMVFAVGDGSGASESGCYNCLWPGRTSSTALAGTLPCSPDSQRTGSQRLPCLVVSAASDVGRHGSHARRRANVGL
jgi:hypothetical protein